MRADKLLKHYPDMPLNAVLEPEAKDWPTAKEQFLEDGRSHETALGRGMDAACEGSTLPSCIWHRRLQLVENRRVPWDRMNAAAGTVSES
jgi:hypothetical protein